MVEDNDEGDREYVLEIIQTARSNRFTYRPIVVSGRRPGRMPPPLALRGWVQLNWGVTGVEADRAAFRLSRFIGAHGTQLNDYTIRTVRESEKDINETGIILGQELKVFITEPF